MTQCDELIIVIDNVSTEKTNTTATTETNAIATDAKSTASINCLSKKVKDYYIFHTVLLVIILLLIIFICYYYVKKKGTI